MGELLAILGGCALIWLCGAAHALEATAADPPTPTLPLAMRRTERSRNRRI